ncbi:MAG TPA: carboxypeptidase-like regulatory domain-containing protein, partial [Niabella sp.]|nr:carboxypeptidase-like regulatory domain-containing protein [Niabella sp.]
MRITAALMLVFCLQVSAEGRSQKITFTAKGISLRNALEQVEKQTDYFVVYNQLMLGKNDNRISLKVTNMLLRDYLDLVLRETDLDFIMENKTIILTQKSGTTRQAEVYQPPVKGVVRGADGTALSGASVNVKGGTAGTKTDENGMFTIDVQVGQTLIVTFVGFNPQEVTITGTEDLNISLVPLDNKLESVVVVGYGTQKKRDLTGSIASVSGEEVTKAPNLNPLSSLQGKVAGLT